MKKFILFTLLLSLYSSAYTSAQITVLAGTQVVNGLTVTVSRSNPQPSSATMCSTGPYQIGRTYSDWYKYEFLTQPASHFTVKMIRLHNDDSVQIIVNGTPYNVTGATAYNGDATCNLTSNNVNFPGNGLITTTGGASGQGQGIQFDVSVPGSMIDSVRIVHTRSAANILASDVIYAADCRLDTCNMRFIADKGPQICEGKDLQMTATEYPNTTYKWEPATGVIPPVMSPSDAVHDPLFKSIAAINTGAYYVIGTRGACEYRDTITLSISPAPMLGPVKQLGPLCPGGDDTMYLPNIVLPAGGTAYAWNKATGILTEFDVNFQITFASVGLNNRANYIVYAKDVQGCTTDSVDFYFDVLNGVVAGFNYDVKEGCEEDTIVFKNTSLGHKSQTWDFGDNTPIATEADPTHYYTVPKPNHEVRTFKVKLRIENTSCADSSEKEIELTHVLKPKFYMDDDSICQGTVITFSDSSRVKPGTSPRTMWDIGYGKWETHPEAEYKHEYKKAGIYHPKVVLTDYLGCVDSYSIELVVDSTGYIDFTSDKESACLGEEFNFTGEYYAGGALFVNWDFNDGVIIPNTDRAKHSYPEEGNYSVTYNVDYRICPDRSVTKEVRIKAVPKIYLGEDTAICPNADAIYLADIFNVSGNDDITYTWNTVTKDVAKGVYVRHPGTYAVTAELDGCKTSDTVEVRKNCYIDIPNAFTPNGDGVSDYFLPRQLLSRNVAEFSMQIYNRWGQQVYLTQSANGRGWDGRLNGVEQPMGVYVYTIQVTFGNGVAERYQGNVSLLR